MDGSSILPGSTNGTDKVSTTDEQEILTSRWKLLTERKSGKQKQLTKQRISLASSYHSLPKQNPVRKLAGNFLSETGV
jgi:hypothetical protein